MFDITINLKKHTSKIGYTTLVHVLNNPSQKKEFVVLEITYFDYCDRFPREMVASIYEKCNNPYRNFVPKKKQQKLMRCFGTSGIFEADWKQIHNHFNANSNYQ